MSYLNLTAMICDHHLDPRLRKRALWLKNAYGSCDLYVDYSRGQHFQVENEENDYIDISKAKVNRLKKYNLIYISGAKVILTSFIKFLLLRYVYKVALVYEIPDLPLRSHNKIVNDINSILFRLIVKVLFKRVVITSKAFLPKLPSKLDYFECENFPSPELLNSVEKNSQNEPPSNITISFVGVLRYFPQMELLIKFASLHSHVNVRFHGGPNESINKLKLLCNKYDNKSNVEFFGQFESGELAGIYSASSFIYSVYDSQQDNVKLALPNKLYESIVYSIPLIVSTNTYLHERVQHENNGFGVDSQCYSQFEKDMLYGLNKNYNFNGKKLRNEILGQENSFLKWLENRIDFNTREL